MAFAPAELEDLIASVGELLADDGVLIETVAIGGGGLMLLGLVQRPTRDLDLVAIIEQGKLRKPEPMPAALRKAIDAVSALRRVDNHWMNGAPSGLLDHGLPDGFMQRAVRRQFGGLVVYLASRTDQIAFKLYAAVDQGPDSKHVSDLKQEVRLKRSFVLVIQDQWIPSSPRLAAVRQRSAGSDRYASVVDEH